MAKPFKNLKERMPPERREKVERRAEAILLGMALQELRKSRGLTQQDLAEILQVNQAALSKMESQADMRVSTLRKILAAMGGSLKLVAAFPNGEVVIERFEGE